jgi:hypothetical protein
MSAYSEAYVDELVKQNQLLRELVNRLTPLAGTPVSQLAKPTPSESNIGACTPCPAAIMPQIGQLPTPLTSSKHQVCRGDPGCAIATGAASGEDDDDFGRLDWPFSDFGDDSNVTGKDANNEDMATGEEQTDNNANAAGEENAAGTTNKLAPPASKLNPGSGSLLGDLAHQAEAGGIPHAVRALLIKDIQAARHVDGSLASEVGSLLDIITQGAASKQIPETEFYTRIVPERSLYLNDILSLWVMRGQDISAWFTDALMHSLLKNEAKNTDDVFIDCNLDHFLSDEYSEQVLELDIARARMSREPMLGWPLVDLHRKHTRILATINPTKAHWVTVEITLAENETDSAKLQLYNSLRSASGKGATIRMVTETLPKILYLASLRPGSPLAGFDPHKLQIEEVNCPQQAGASDCGPFSLWFAARRLYKQSVWTDLPTETDRSEFGLRMRIESARIIKGHLSGTTGSTFKTLFDANEERAEQAPVVPSVGPELPDGADAANGADGGEPGFYEDENDDAEHGAIRLEFGTQNDSRPSILDIDPELLDGADVANGADGGEPGLDDGEGERAEQERASILRLEFGKRSDSYPSIIVVIRFSSTPSWWHRSTREDIEARFLSITRQRIQMYLTAVDIPGSDVHVIVHVAIFTRTRYMPCMPEFVTNDPVTNEPITNEPATNEPVTNDPTGQIVYTMLCPLCEWTESSDSPGSLLAHVKRHYPSHNRQFYLLASEGSWDAEGKYHACSVDGCGHITRPSNKKYVKTYAVTHWAAEHGTAWLEEQGKQLQIMCNCNDCKSNDNRTWNYGRDFLKHIKGFNRSFTCPFCGPPRSFRDIGNFTTHTFTHHWDDEAPPGWHRCNHEMTDELNKPWSEMVTKMRERLAILSAGKCAWAEAGADCRLNVFRQDKQVRKHYDDDHKDDYWPFSGGDDFRCSILYQDKEALHRHEQTSHRDQHPQSWRESWYMLRAQQFTEAITADLRSLSHGIKSPVLLSVGIDGFTCNAPLLQQWLQAVNLEFEFAISTGKIPEMNEQHFTQVNGSYIGRYDSRVLQTSLQDISQAPEAYSDLIAVWNEQQQTKNTLRRLHAPRAPRVPRARINVG